MSESDVSLMITRPATNGETPLMGDLRGASHLGRVGAGLRMRILHPLILFELVKQAGTRSLATTALTRG
jgi:hypothetical protein